MASAVAIAALTLMPTTPGPTSGHLCIICGPYGGVDAVLNVLLFVPLGVGLSLLGVPPIRAVAVALACTIAIELAQVRLVQGRDASLGDVVMNTFGGAIGVALARARHALRRPSPDMARTLFLGWLMAWIAAQAFVAYTIAPSLPAPPYFGQIDRPRGHSRPAFPGDVLGASVDSLPLVRGALANAAAVRARLDRREGATLRAVVIPRGIVAGKAEVVVISGPGMIPVASLEQGFGSLVFGVRTGAERLRLRPYEFRMDSVFDQLDARDTVTVQGRYSSRLVVLSATGVRLDRERQFVPRLSLGWVPFVPAGLFIDGDPLEYLVSATFVLLLAAPAGYWAMFRKRNTKGISGVIATMALAVGLYVVPGAFGISPAAPWEAASVVLGGICGLSLGWRATRRRPPAG